jgi:hypothetical protein
MNLQSRVRNILVTPKTEWTVIASEPSSVASIYTSYVLILAAIPAVCTFIGVGLLSGIFAGGGYGAAAGLIAGVMSYVNDIVGCLIAAFVVQALASTFGSRGDFVQALKLAAYAYTPIWIAGVLHLFILLSVLIVVAAIYAIYLFYLGLPPVMHTPQDKVIPYMLVSAVVIIVVHFVLGMLMGMAAVGSMFAPRMF